MVFLTLLLTSNFSIYTLRERQLLTSFIRQIDCQLVLFSLRTESQECQENLNSINSCVYTSIDLTNYIKGRSP